MAGTISSTITSSYTLVVNPTTILSTGGVVANSANPAIAGPSGTAWTIVNGGLISNNVYTDVFLASGGSITNTTSGVIDGSGGGTAVLIAIGGGLGTIVNDGQIGGSAPQA